MQHEHKLHFGDYRAAPPVSPHRNLRVSSTNQTGMSTRTLMGVVAGVTHTPMQTFIDTAPWARENQNLA